MLLSPLSLSGFFLSVLIKRSVECCFGNMQVGLDRGMPYEELVSTAILHPTTAPTAASYAT